LPVSGREIKEIKRSCSTQVEHKAYPVIFDHNYVRDASIPVWHGWHAARGGLGSNLYHSECLKK
jgi:hypothetical protein